MRYSIIFLALFLLGCSNLPRGISRDNDGRYTLGSPDGSLAVHASANGPLTYSVTLDGKPILNDSHLGMQFSDGSEIGRNCTITSAIATVQDTTWENRFGKR